MRKRDINTKLFLLLILAISILGCKKESPKLGVNQHERYISLSPVITEILIGLECTDKIIAVDTNSIRCKGIDPNILTLDLMSPDIEKIITLSPTRILVSEMSLIAGKDPFIPLKRFGIEVDYITTSNCLADISDNILHIAKIVNKTELASEISSSYQQELEIIRTLSQKVTDKKSVYFELSDPPYMYSFGSGVYLDEMIQLVGAVNVLSEQEGWLSISSENLIVANPMVIITDSDIADAKNLISNRAGWSNIDAVKNGSLYTVDRNRFSLASQHIIECIWQLGKILYHEVYSKIEE